MVKFTVLLKFAAKIQQNSDMYKFNYQNIGNNHRAPAVSDG